jgi:hypothetical protein
VLVQAQLKRLQADVKAEKGERKMAEAQYFELCGDRAHEGRKKQADGIKSSVTNDDCSGALAQLKSASR